MLRRAHRNDIPFVIEAIRAAESAMDPMHQTSYEKLFSLSSQETDALLKRCLLEPSGDHPLALSSFFVLDEKEPLAACAAWVEPREGLSSGFLQASVLCSCLGIERWSAGKAGVQALAGATPARTPGALQLESFFVAPAHRGLGLVARLIREVTGWFAQNNLLPAHSEISLLKSNRSALAAYQRAGYHVAQETHSTDPGFLALTGCEGFIQVRR